MTIPRHLGPPAPPDVDATWRGVRSGLARRRAITAAATGVALVVLATGASGGASSAGRIRAGSGTAPGLASGPGAGSPCRDSTDPACGPFQWSPAPSPDQPLSIALEVMPAEPRPGEEVTVRAVVTDPDAPVTTNGGMYFWDDPYDTAAQIGFASTMARGPERFGPWTPPTPRPGQLELFFTHAFSQPGAYRFHLEARSGDESDPGNPARHPYASSGAASVEIVVAATPGPETQRS